MNINALVARVDRLIEAADHVRSRPVHHRTVTEQEALSLAEPVIEIARHIQPDLASQLSPAYVSMAGYNWSTVIDAAHRLKGILQARADLDRELGPSGPRLSASAMHPWVWTAAATHWDDGKHEVAVREAARALLVHLRSKSGFPDLEGEPLVNALFSYKDPQLGQPRLRLPHLRGATDATRADVERGVASLARACVQLIRNPHTHDDLGLDETTALEMLATLSLFARHADEAELVEHEDEPPCLS